MPEEQTAAEIAESDPSSPAEPALEGEPDLQTSRPFPLPAFKALAHRNFRLFFGGQLISLSGTWMQSVAQGWLVLKLTNSPLMLGLVAFAGYAPILLVSLFAGVVVDHVDRRRLILLAQCMLMLSALVLAALTWTHVVRVEHVMMLAVLNGLVSSFDMPGRQAFLVEMVGREDLPNAIALNSMIFNGARVLGPAVAGMLVIAVGEAGCFLLNGLSYIAVIWSLSAMDLPRRELQRFGTVILQRVHEGLLYVWRHKPTLYLLFMVAIASGFGMQYTVLVPLFARDLLHGGVRAYGFLLAAQGFGALGGAMVVASRSSAPRALRQNMTVGIFCLALAICIFALSHTMVVALASQVLVGIGIMGYMATTNTLLQQFVSDELRGRVMSIYTLSFIGMAPLGSLEVGFVGEHVGPRAAVLSCGLISLACAFYLLSKLKVLASAEIVGHSSH